MLNTGSGGYFLFWWWQCESHLHFHRITIKRILVFTVQTVTYMWTPMYLEHRQPCNILLNCNFTFYWEENREERLPFNLLYVGLSYIGLPHIKGHLSDTKPLKTTIHKFHQQDESGLQREFFILVCF